jgi:hypothetical protein
LDGEYPEKSVDITPAKLEQVTGEIEQLLVCEYLMVLSRNI